MCVLLRSNRNWGYGVGLVGFFFFKHSFLVLDLPSLFCVVISFNNNMPMCFGHLKKKKFKNQLFASVMFPRNES